VTPSHRFIDSPLGPILLSVDGSGRLTGVRLGRDPGAAAVPSTVPEIHAESHAEGHAEGYAEPLGHIRAHVLDDVTAQLGEYFAGRRTCFDVALAMEGSSFQRLVWSRLRQIPFATTVSYGQLAAQLGRPGAARAIGHANARNPIAIIVPCHRVIGSSGHLTGYGGGLEAKRHLLDLEVRHGAAVERPATDKRGPRRAVSAERGT